jgi:hypothetical protein
MGAAWERRGMCVLAFKVPVTVQGVIILDSKISSTPRVRKISGMKDVVLGDVMWNGGTNLPTFQDLLP